MRETKKSTICDGYVEYYPAMIPKKLAEEFVKEVEGFFPSKESCLYTIINLKLCITLYYLVGYHF